MAELENVLEDWLNTQRANSPKFLTSLSFYVAPCEGFIKVFSLSNLTIYFSNIYLVVFVSQETWWALLLLSLWPVGCPFYVPGVAPRDFHEGDVVDIKVRLK